MWEKLIMQDLEQEYKQDCEIDQTDLANECVRVPKLHAKYTSYLKQERWKQFNLQNQYKRLLVEKRRYYLDGPTQEDIDKGWHQYPRGKKVLTTQVDIYLDADNEMMELSNKIEMSQERIDRLEKYLKEIMQRSYLIGHMVNYMKFMSGN
jgi:hypothetical protein